MATSPAPDAAAPPGMCPGIAVLGGGGGSGDGDGSGSGGKDGSGGGGGGDGQGGAGDGKEAQGAPDYAKYPTCGYASHPVDVVTGRAFTLPITDLELPGPLPLRFQRMYSSKMAERDVGLGHGWGHSFGWEIEIGRRQIRVWNEQGIAVDFPMIPGEGEIVGPWGWLLRRDGAGFALDADDGVWRLFSPADSRGRRHRLTTIRDRNDNRITLTYEDGRLSEVTDSAGRVIRVRSTKERRIASLEVQNAVSHGKWIAFAMYTYDEHGDLTSALDADGFSAHYAYDEEHRLTADTDRTGLCFHFVYDREGRCVESWGDYPGRKDISLADGLPARLADGTTRVKGISHCRFDYHGGGYSEVADSRRVRRFFGNRRGLLDKRVEGAGVVSCTYDEDGHLLSRTDEMGGVARFERDARGRLTKITDVMERVTVIERNEHGLPARIVDPAGGVTTLDHDRFGNLVRRVGPTGSVSTYRYDDRGLLVEAVDADGARQRFEYDTQGNRTAIHEANGATTRLTYNAFGYTTAVTDPLGATTRFAYSARGDLVSVSDAAGGVTRYSYDGEGYLLERVSPGGHRRKQRWGGYHKLCEIVDEAGSVTRATYDLDGYPVELWNPKGEVHRYQHDPSGRLLAETAFDGARTEYRYDIAGRIIAVIDALGRRSEFVRDRAGTVIERHFSDDLDEVVAYDARGQVIGARVSGVEIRIERDAGGAVVRQTQVIGGESYTVEVSQRDHQLITRTSLGQSVAEQHGSDPGVKRFILGGSHEVVSLGDALGREVKRQLPGGGAIASVFDAVGRLAERRVSSPAMGRAAGPGEPEWLGERTAEITARRAYRYDTEGRLTGVWDPARGVTQYQADPVGRPLAVARGEEVVEAYRYDAAGDITSAGGEPLEYEKGNRLVIRGATRYAYDALGQLVEKRTRGASGAEAVWTYGWNAAGRLTSVTATDGTRVEFLYDPFGRRVQKRVSGRSEPGAPSALRSVTTFVWDGSMLVHEIKRSARASGDPIVEERSYWMSADFVPLAHRDVRRDEHGVTEGEWVHYVTDSIGTPERLVDARGEVVCELQRTAWGRTAPRPGAKATTPLRFMGQYEDAETGLHYNHFRYYDPETGRYISPDPIGVEGGINLFRYVEDPNTMVDPFGLSQCQCVMITRNGPPNRRVNGSEPPLYAWRRNSNTPAAPGGIAAANIPERPSGTRPPTPGNMRGQCAEPRVLSDYQQWLESPEGQRGADPNHSTLERMQAGVVSITPMPVDAREGSYRAPCGFCDHRPGSRGMLDRMNLRDRVMTPDQAQGATGLPASVFRSQ